MNQYGLLLHSDVRATIRSVSAEQFAAQKLNPPPDAGILYRVDGILFGWTGDRWANISPIVSSEPPDDDDGLPDGTIYIQLVA